MEKPTKVLPQHAIYGRWDGMTSSQILVYYQPNGLNCTLFLMAGSDYGGGIDLIKETSCAHFEELVNTAAHDSELYTMCKSLNSKR